MKLPDVDRILLGPGPSLTSPRVMRALASPTVRCSTTFASASSDRLFGAPPGPMALAVSGTGTSGMETAVANLVQPGTKVLAVVTGYFGDRLAEVCARYGADVKRLVTTSICSCSRTTGSGESITTRCRRRSSRPWPRPSRPSTKKASRHDGAVMRTRALGMTMLPPALERLWTLNAVVVPHGIDEAAVRKHLLEQFNIEIGAGLGPPRRTFDGDARLPRDCGYGHHHQRPPSFSRHLPRSHRRNGTG